MALAASACSRSRVSIRSSGETEGSLVPARPSVARTKNTSAPSLTHLTTVPPQPPSASSGWGVKIKARSGVSNGSIDLSSLFAWAYVAQSMCVTLL